MKEVVILVHGYNKNQDDMLSLKKNLEKSGYQAIVVDLPLTFKKIKQVTKVFAKQMEKIITSTTAKTFNFVGHSTGGLVIRHFLAKTKLEFKLGRVVLIATPNHGSKLAEIASLIKPITNIFKTLDSLQPKQLKKLELSIAKEVEIGAIAGNKNNLLLGYLLDKENDGRVRVDSVRDEGLSDFVILSYGHKEIHHQTKTAKLVINFLEKGKFKINS